MKSRTNSGTLCLLIALLLIACQTEQKTLTDNGDSINYQITLGGDTVLTGKPLPITGKWIDPKEVKAPIVTKIGKPVVTAIPSWQFIIKPEEPKIFKGMESPLPQKKSQQFKLQSEPVHKSPPTRSLSLRYKDAAQINIRYLDIEQGLSSSYIYKVLMDKRQNIWFATQDGAVKYDGLNFDKYARSEGLNHPAVSAMIEDTKGNIWFGNLGGITKYDGLEFSHVTQKEGLLSDQVWSIYEDSFENIWIGTVDGVSKLTLSSDDQVSIINFTREDGLSGGTVWTIQEDLSRNIWIGTEEGLSRIKIQNDTSETSTITNYNLNNGFNDGVTSLTLDHDGHLWVGFENSGLTKLIWGANDFQSYERYTTDQKLLSNQILSLFEDTNKDLWIGYDKSGLSKMSLDANSGQITITHFTEGQGLSHGTVTALTEDTQGNLWIGTFGGGASVLGSKVFRHFTERLGLPDRLVLSMAETDESIWFGTRSGGLTKYVKGAEIETFMTFNNEDGLLDNSVRSLHIDQHNNLWIGTEKGVNRLNESGDLWSFTTEQGLVGNYVRRITEDSFGNLWFATEGGVCKYSMYDDHGAELPADLMGFTHYSKDHLLNASIRSLLIDKEGGVWFGSNEGIALLSIKVDKETITYYTEKEGLPDKHIRSTFQDSSGNLWVGSHGGLSRFSPHSTRHDQFLNFSTNDGMSDNSIWSIIEDPQGTLWLGTERGITQLTSQSSSDNKGYDIRTLGQEDGLKGIDFYANSVLLDKEDNLWWGSGKCLTLLDLSTKSDKSTKPELVLNNIYLDINFVDYGRFEDPGYLASLGIPSDFSDLKTSVQPFTNYPSSLELPSNLNHIDFDVSAIDWSGPQQVRFRYFLEGLESGWGPLEKTQLVGYRNVPPGNYTFKAKARGAWGEWSDTLSYSFSISPPWWQTLWARSILVVLSLSAIIGLIRLRTAQLLRTRQKLIKTIDERTAELKSKNSELQKVNEELKEFTYILSHDLRSPLRGISSLTKWIHDDNIKTLAGESIKHMQLLIHKVDIMQEFLDGILMYYRVGSRKEEPEMTSVKEIILQVQDLLAIPQSFQLIVKEPLPYLVLSKVHLTQIFQNLISNAMKYMDKDEGLIEIGYEHEKAPTFYVKDNGPGIESNHHDRIFKIFQTLKSSDNLQSIGIGLSIVKKIVDSYGGKIWIESDLGKGSTFYFTFNERYLAKEEETLA